MKKFVTLCAAIGLLLLGCAGSVPKSSQTRQTSSAWVESTLKRLTLEEKVSQLICFWTLGRYYPANSDHWQELERLAVKRKIGNFVFSIGDVYEYAVQINKLQKLADVPLLIAGDFEYGVAMRVRHSTMFPRAMAIGATHNPKYAYELGRITALEGRALGIHQNYAPVLDVNNNARNPVINTRAFGDDVKLVTDMGIAFVKGTQDGGMIATIKHFPGHGDTDIDTHVGLSVLNLTKERLQSVELPPFKEAIQAGALSVMVGHPSVPAYDTVVGIPATVSHNVSTTLLQGELQFADLIVTDALQMRGVSEKYLPGEAAVLSVKAGADIVLMPVDVDIAIDAIVAAVKRGEISVERIDHSVRKLLTVKERMSLNVNRFVDVDKVAEAVGAPEHQRLALEIARNAVTVLGNQKNILPLSKVDSSKILDVVISDSEDLSDGRSFHFMMQQRRGRMGWSRIGPNSNQLDHDSTMAKARRADMLLVQLHLYTRSGELTGFVDSNQVALVKNLSTLGKPMVGIAWGNPYVAMDLPPFDAYICTYSDAECMQQAAAEVIFAEEPAKGKLPITIPELYKFGEGIEYPKLTLRDGLPEEAGFNSQKLKLVDDVINSAAKDSAFPGAVLLVAKDGIVVYNKGYGFFDYAVYSKSVHENTIYDLASVTKVISTTSAIMRLVDDGKLSLNDPIVNHLPQFGQRGKEKLTVYNLMVHNSGLPAWRRFYDFCTTPQCVLDSVFASPLVYKTGDSTIYSDLGLITIGKLIEKITGVGLDKYVDSVFFKPLGMRNTMYNPASDLWDRIVPTEVDTFWQRTGIAVRGRVHDENAAVLGGVSGHAGLFSTTSDLSIMLQMLLNGGTYGGRRFIKEETVKQFTTRQSDKSSRAIGWDTKSSDRSFSGTLTSTKTFLHTGFTGTSVVVDPEKKVIIVFLTNRVHPSRASTKIFDVRPRVHDAVLNALVRENTRAASPH
ncbi:MAG: serine hydrolase [Ignavibacteriales bacterium]|nr:serine hydrolase [Ignavibacteriales bacterium]